MGDWSLEQRLTGSPPPAQLPPELLDESISFLVTLGGLGDNSTPTASPSADAEAIARVLGGDRAQALHRLGSQVEQTLADVPRIFAHGDFWSRNLLIEDEGSPA